MNTPIPIKNADIAVLEKTLIDLINTFPELPVQVEKDGVFFQNLKPKNISMGLSTIPSNSIIGETWVCGSYFAQYWFKIMLQKMSITNEELIESQNILGKITAWLEKTPIEKSDGTIYKLEEYPKLEGNINISAIEKIGHPRLVSRIPPNIEIHEAKLKLNYFVKKSLF
jgi:hypothetical protein